LQINKADPLGRSLQGRLALARNQVAEAIAIFQKVVKDQPKLASAHYFLGLAYLHNQNTPLARTAFAEAIKVAPDFPEAHLAMTELHMQSRSFDLAIGEAQHVLRLHPAHPGPVSS
jgi:Flp pilus assembly protein TadD